MNKGRVYGIPGIGLAGDWPGGWTQTYAQIDTEAGAHGFDRDYFVQQVAGLSQLAGELMRVEPLVIDLGWGKLKSSLAKLPDAGFVAPEEAAAQRRMLLGQYVAAFRQVEAGSRAAARSLLKDLAAGIAARLASEQHAAVNALVEAQLAKLA
jgi:hypothetical protein